jgi:hypothetical protein
MIASTFVARLLAAGLALGTFTACCGGWQDPEPIPFGINADLAAVTSIRSCNALECWLAVGAEGTIVWARWPTDATEFEIGSFDLGDADLTATLTTDSAWWVVGASGTVAHSTDAGATWQSVDPGTSANLYGIAQHADWIVAVGDEVVVVHRPNEDWADAPPPPGGWGELRGVHSHRTRVYTVGSGGIVWSAADPSDEWILENVGVDTDLFAVSGPQSDADRVLIVGARGTLVVGNHDEGWRRVATKTTADLLSISYSKILVAGGEVLEHFLPSSKPNSTDELLSIDTLAPDARALASSGRRVAVVGDGGDAQRSTRVVCGF